MEFRILGPIEAHADHQVVDLGRPQQRLVLAMLLVELGRPVSTETMIDRVWETAPPGARRIVHVHITRLRRLLAEASPADPVRLLRRSGGYLLDIGADRVDAHRFQRLVELARHRDCPETERVSLLGRALELWRGQPLSDLPGPWAKGVRQGWRQQYLEAAVVWAQACVHSGDPEAALPRLGALVREHPLMEPLAAAYLRALYAAGRPADALDYYATLRRRLADELGVDPSGELQQVHRRILSVDPALAAPPRPVAGIPPDARAVPRQLPAPPQPFTGRAGELTDLGRAGGAPAVAIVTIDGMAGVGKTALAVHAAHQLSGRYPDGQLFIDLHGYTQGVAPLEPIDALDQLLRALGIPGTEVPAGLDQRAALYRTRLAGQRVLLVLDNASTEARTAPLLPGAAGCLVLVTSRHRLTGLDHTHAISLDTLPTSDAISLFVQMAGVPRLADQPPELLTELVSLCGRLPLAIRIAAARLRSHPSWSVAHLVARLRDKQRRMNELETGQRSVTAALDLSYQHLGAEQRLAYQLLGQHPGVEFDGYATAALLDSTLLHAERMLDHLLDAHLLQEPRPSRYRFHDLIRAHATHTAARDKIGHSGRAALDRLLDHYLYAASATMDAAYAFDRENRPQVPRVRTADPEPLGPAAALEWLDTELPNLLATARYAITNDRPRHLLDLSKILHRHLLTRGRYSDAHLLHERALEIAGTIDDQAGQRDALVRLGNVHWRQGRYAQAADHHRRALRIARALGQDTAKLAPLVGLGDILMAQGRFARAAEYYRQVLRIARAASGRPASALEALIGLAYIHTVQGRLARAADHYRQALEIAQAIGHQSAQINVLIGLAYGNWVQGRVAHAADHYQQALRIARVTGYRPGEINALTGLGNVHWREGRQALAADHYQEALRIARATGHLPGEMNSLTVLGRVCRLQGEYAQAGDYFTRLLDLARDSGDRNWEFEAWHGLGRLRAATGDHETAIGHYQRARELADELSQPNDQALARDGLANSYLALDQHEDARQHWQQALDLLIRHSIDRTEHEETSTAAISAHLERLGQSPAGGRRRDVPVG